MIDPRYCLTLKVTYACPLTCAHCGIRSGPQERGALPLETVVAALDEVKNRGCAVVNLTGGEPFALKEPLVDMVRAAAERGFIVRISTSAFWSPDAFAARARLRPLVEAGLRQLFVSTSDLHRASVPLSNLVEAARAGWSLGLEMHVEVATNKDSATTPRTVREAFAAAGLPVPFILDGAIIPYGRAVDQAGADVLRLKPVEELDDPCPSLGRHPTVEPDGYITGCAVVFARDCPALRLGRLPESSLGAALDRLERDTLFDWIRTRGVVQAKRHLEAHSDLRFDEAYVNICHLCGDLLSQPRAVALLRAHPPPTRAEPAYAASRRSSPDGA